MEKKKNKSFGSSEYVAPESTVFTVDLDGDLCKTSPGASNEEIGNEVPYNW